MKLIDNAPKIMAQMLLDPEKELDVEIRVAGRPQRGVCGDRQ